MQNFTPAKISTYIASYPKDNSCYLIYTNFFLYELSKNEKYLNKINRKKNTCLSWTPRVIDWNNFLFSIFNGWLS